MTKKLGVTLMGLFVLVFSGVNLYFYFSKGKKSYAAISGMFISEGTSLDVNISLIAFVLQWVILILIVLFSYTKFIKQKKSENLEGINLKVADSPQGTETELDVLYGILKEKGRLSIGAIVKAFNIEKEMALEWARILEEHDLVTIEYPAFNDPEVEIKKEKTIKK